MSFVEYRDDGVFKQSEHITVCAQCGYRFESGDEALRVNETGDVIHVDCWMDYTDDNIDEFTQKIEF